MAKYNFYAVAYGVNPQSKEPVFNLKFRTWEECKPFVVGIEGSKYKGFLTDAEADAWLDAKMAKLLEDGNLEKNANPELKQRDWKEDIKKIGLAKIHPVDEAFLYTCKDLGISQVDIDHLLKKMFVDVVKYLKDNDCLREPPFD